MMHELNIRPPHEPYNYTRSPVLGELAGAINAALVDFAGVVSPAPANSNPERRARLLAMMERDLCDAVLALRKLSASDFAATFEPGHQHVNQQEPGHTTGGADAPNGEQP